ncbi:type II secretion system inner membrane protein GspF [Paraperlucidibaca wandonensis]|jgi:general secretion pathway protein F|uniref:General secretion pathway protein F n=1 Tax=Paraperlucidibaca wandonensis TaxID=1268273 RepID=A0ABW3HEB5_9GAMM|nr:type II secretion system inner membrane protein GspF [Paraperlucidibaca sp.]|tara:strand:- start:2983 stop:4206 length:1224 start_codon:yes stop_codon:yes gene_type:complete
MAAFDYVGVDPQGKRRKGVIDADNLRHARSLLRERQLVPISVNNASEKPAAQQAGMSFSFFKPKLSAQDLALITRQIATLVQAGLTLDDSLRSVAQQSEKATVKRLLTAVRSKVVEGYTLAQSLAEFPQAFPSLYRATVAAGERAGHLDLVLNRLADYTESRYETRRKVQGALIYPAILTVLSLLIVIGLLTYVVPDIVKVFDNQGQALPMITQLLIATSDFLRESLGTLVLIGIALSYFVYRLLQKPAMRYRWHAFMLRLPVAGKLIRDSQASRFVSTLAILTRSGVPLVDALRIAAEVVDNLPMREAVSSAADRVTEGGRLAPAIEQAKLFPPMMTNMIASGEASGELDEMLMRTGQMQERALTGSISTLVGLFEPMMLLMMAGVVLVIVLAIMLPIVQMNNLVN